MTPLNSGREKFGFRSFFRASPSAFNRASSASSARRCASAATLRAAAASAWTAVPMTPEPRGCASAGSAKAL
ncbi:hypothetical protein OPT61_g8937 [Boeremia exigua]|uniref:Uncharacterized protein n=1 Tax=Boeremia exigua TaxID=749465 RepID=A0ACC2HX36_9PLEO|nr:hypothetical protein OPT61_g8937 [Boeremia exigua]